jgi:hypothetical protein
MEPNFDDEPFESDCSYDRECAIVELKLVLPTFFKFGLGMVSGNYQEPGID